MQDLASYAKESFSSTYSPLSAMSSLSILLQKGNAEILSQGCLLALLHSRLDDWIWVDGHSVLRELGAVHHPV